MVESRPGVSEVVVNGQQVELVYQEDDWGARGRKKAQ